MYVCGGRRTKDGGDGCGGDGDNGDVVYVW